jgi:hypothetical protein
MMAALTPKEGLDQEDKITARISGRSHLFKEKEAKNYNYLCGGGGGSKMATQVMPPTPKLAEFPPNGGSAIFPTM